MRCGAPQLLELALRQRSLHAAGHPLSAGDTSFRYPQREVEVRRCMRATTRDEVETMVREVVVGTVSRGASVGGRGLVCPDRVTCSSQAHGLEVPAGAGANIVPV